MTYDGEKRTLSQPDNMSVPDGQYVLEDKPSELVCKERREKASMVLVMARKEEMVRGIFRGVLERVDTIHMVESIISDEVDRLEGWMLAKDSMETVLGLT